MKKHALKIWLAAGLLPLICSTVLYLLLPDYGTAEGWVVYPPLSALPESQPEVDFELNKVLLILFTKYYLFYWMAFSALYVLVHFAIHSIKQHFSFALHGLLCLFGYSLAIASNELVIDHISNAFLTEVYIGGEPLDFYQPPPLNAVIGLTFLTFPANLGLISFILGVFVAISVLIRSLIKRVPATETRDEEWMVTNIITEAFTDNPSVLAVIKNDWNKEERINALALYAYRTAKAREGVHLSADKTAVALCYRYRFKKETIADYLNQLRLVNKAIGWGRLLKLMKRDSYIKKTRPEKDDFLYFWFFGVRPQHRGNGAALELKNKLFSLSEELQLPIYLETSVAQNKRIYERYGFEVYHEWNPPGETPLWFMRRIPG